MAFRLDGNRLTLEWVAGEYGTPALSGDHANFDADPWFELAGGSSNESADDGSATDGGLLLTTQGNANDRLVVVPRLETGHAIWDQITFGSDDETEWECLIKVGTVVDDIVWAGLKLTSTDIIAADDDSAFFRYENGVNNGVWQSNVSVGGVDSTVTAGVVGYAGQVIRFRVEFDASEIAHMYINDNEVQAVSFSGSTADLKPYIGVSDGAGGTESTLTVYGQKISRLVK